MNPAIWTYVGILVTIIILLWALFEVRGRFTRLSRKKPNIGATKNTKNMNTWIKLDSTPLEAIQEEPQLLPSLHEDEEDEQEEEAQHNLHIRSQQNGHYSQSKKPL